MKKFRSSGALCVTAAVLAAVSIAGCEFEGVISEADDSSSSPPLDAPPQTQSLKAILSSDNVVPAAECGAAGEAVMELDKEGKKLCYSISLKETGSVMGGHLHTGKRGDMGSQLVDLRLRSRVSESCRAHRSGELFHASDGAAGDGFGKALAARGRTLLVGASNAVYSFEKHEGVWEERQKLTAPEGNFGASVSVSGDTAVVAASGAAYVYVKVGGNWVEQQKLLPSGSDQGFAAGVAVFGNTLLVGAPSDVLDSDNFGSVYVFQRSGSVWTEQTRLRAGQNLDGGSCFGCAVGLFGESALVGAPAAFPTDFGRFFFFEGSGATWTSVPFNQPPNDNLTTDGGNLGRAVSLFGSTAAIGAPGQFVFEGPFLRSFGAVHVFERGQDGWDKQSVVLTLVPGVSGRSPTTALTAADQSIDLAFGSSVSLAENRALIGAPKRPNALPTAQPGAAYLFERSGSVWKEIQKLSAAPEEDQVGFGAAVALTKQEALMGAPGDESTPGAVFVQGLEDRSCIPPRQHFEGCVDVDHQLLEAIRNEPNGYYVDIHTDEFPEGATRGNFGH